MDMKAQKFGVEIEMTGLTRATAAEVLAEHFGTAPRHVGGSYDEYAVLDEQGRKWKLVSDGSISAEVKRGSSRIPTNDYAYKVEFVTPICDYDDITAIQEIVRKLRSAGAVSNSSCGMHVHVDASPFNANALRNLTNIMAAKEDLIYKALQVEVDREHRFCNKTDTRWLEELNRVKPKTLEEVSEIWYKQQPDGDRGSQDHYHR